MSAGNSLHKDGLTLEARKHLLLVACTLDRVSLVAKFRPGPKPGNWYVQLATQPWFDAASTVVERFFPRKLRLLAAVWRAVSRSRRGR